MVEVAFNFDERVPIFRATLNGTPFERFLLDTGAPASFVRASHLPRLGFPAGEDGEIWIESFRVGELELGPTEFRVLPDYGGTLDGLIGVRDFDDFCVSFDFERRMCCFARGVTTESGVSSPLELFRGRPITPVQVGNQTLRFVVDTGGGSNWLFPRGEHKVSHLAISESMEGEANFGAYRYSRALQIEGLKFGGRVHDQTRFLIADSGPLAREENPEDGILGMGALSKACEVVLDFNAGRFAVFE